MRKKIFIDTIIILVLISLSFPSNAEEYFDEKTKSSTILNIDGNNWSDNICGFNDRELGNQSYKNHKPIVTINGPVLIRKNVKYTFNITGNDPDGDKLKRCGVDWGDNNIDIIFGSPYSNNTYQVKHKYTRNGTYQIIADIEDIHGNVGRSTFFNVTVDDVPPNILLQKPLNAIYIFGIKTIPFPHPLIIGPIKYILNVHDNIGVDKVRFYVDDDLIGDDYTSPYQLKFNRLSLGNHTIRAVAFDLAGNQEINEIEIWKYF